MQMGRGHVKRHLHQMIGEVCIRPRHLAGIERLGGKPFGDQSAGGGFGLGQNGNGGLPGGGSARIAAGGIHCGLNGLRVKQLGRISNQARRVGRACGGLREGLVRQT